ncbi:MAG TPA: BON domain-containing protein [Candidatus Eisenbacteria bacterium]|nr:BON domain-containing protein [Candidatus Eisenbacteria bacterium]
MKISGTFTRGLMLGAGLMYLMDPSEGGRRRARVRDKGVRAWHRSSRVVGKAGRDLRNRARGRIADAASRLRSGGAPDTVIEERVRARLGRVVSHPGAVEVESIGGAVTLSGPILRSETQSLIAAVQSVPGVVDVENRLEEHETGEHVPALQGGMSRKGEGGPSWLPNRWPRAVQYFAGALGAVALVYGASRAFRDRRTSRDEDRIAPNYAYLR